MNLHNELAVEKIHDLKFPIFVFFILKDSLDGNNLSSLFHSAFEDLSEGALPNQSKNFYIFIEDAGGGRIEATFCF